MKKMLAIRLEDDTIKDLKKKSIDDGKSVQQVVTELILKYLGR